MKKINDAVKICAYFGLSALSIFLRIFPVKKNKIYISNYGGKGFGDNPKYIALELMKNHSHYDIVWSVYDMNNEIPEGIRKVKTKSIYELYEIATAKVWIYNSIAPFYARKRKSQMYIETWHGGVSLKKVGYGVETIELLWKMIFHHANTSANFYVSNSGFCSEMYRKEFHYQGKILECGYPRMDIVMNTIEENKITDIKSKLGIPSGKKVALYAPTFRDNGRLDVYDLDVNELMKNLKVNFGGEWIVIVRLHPVIEKENVGFIYSESVLNGNLHSDMYEYMSVTDLLITDYSSSSFEMGFANKIVLLYAKDVEEYSKYRGLYFDVKKLPFPISNTNEELIETIQNFDLIRYEKELEKFNNFLNPYEIGNASKSVVDEINDFIINN